jgi:hypothetical protein
MQGSTGQSGNQNGQKQGGLSWTQSPSSNGAANANTSGGAKPISQTSPTPMQKQSAMPAAAKPASSTSSSSSMHHNKNDMRERSGARTAGIFIAGVIVGLIIGWGWFSLGKNNAAVTSNTNSNGTVTSSSSESTTKPETGTQTTTNNTGSVSTGSNSLAVAPLQTSGLSVTLSSVAVTVPTWVVIFESVNGKPGNALGAKMFFPGEKSGTVELLRATRAGQTYYAGEYVDNGDHIFSKQKDTQVNTTTGAQMLVEFTTR